MELTRQQKIDSIMSRQQKIDQILARQGGNTPPSDVATPEAPEPSDNPDNISQLQAATIGLGKGATLGFQPVIAGAMNIVDAPEPATAKFSPETIKKLLSQSKELAAKGIDVNAAIQQSEQSPTLTNYQSGRDAARDLQESAKVAHPITTMGASTLGSAATGSLLPGNVVVQSGLQGAIEGLGESKADVTKGQFQEAARNTAEGAGLGLAGGSVAGLAGKTLARTGEEIGTVGEAMGRRALGTQSAVPARGLDTVNQYTQEAVNKGVLDTTSSAKQMLAKVKALKDQASPGFENVKTALSGPEAGIDVNEVADRVGQGVKSKYANTKDTKEFVRDLKSDITQNGEDLASVERMKSQYQNSGWSESGKPKESDTAELAREAYRQLDKVYGEEVANVAKTTDNAKLLSDYLQAKKDWGFATTVAKGLEKRVADSGSLAGNAVASVAQALRKPAMVAGAVGSATRSAIPAIAATGANAATAGVENIDPTLKAAIDQILQKNQQP